LITLAYNIDDGKADQQKYQQVGVVSMPVVDINRDLIGDDPCVEERHAETILPELRTLIATGVSAHRQVTAEP
jgi:hypothetical protein